MTDRPAQVPAVIPVPFEDAPGPDLLDHLNEVAGGPMSCEIRALDSEVPPQARGCVLILTGATISSGWTDGMVFDRARPHTGGGDNVILTFSLEGRFHVSQRGTDYRITPGEAYIHLADEPAFASNFPGEANHGLAITMPRAAFAASGIDFHAVMRRPIPAANRALRLLLDYAGNAANVTAAPPQELAAVMASHVCDLAALAMGAGGAAAETAREGGLAAARLKAVKADIVARVARGQSLTLSETARRHGLSSVYVRKLFGREETNFSACVLERRLAHARRMLASPRFASQAVSDIAYTAGFGDLSWFNKAFRRRYGVSPSDVRARPGV